MIKNTASFRWASTCVAAAVAVAVFVVVPLRCGTLFAQSGLAQSGFVQSGSFKQSLSPLLADHCGRCHGPEKQKGGLRLDQLSYDLLHDSAAAETWNDILGVINRGEMPPSDEPQLSNRERRRLVGLLTRELKRVVQAGQSTAGRPVLRRMNRVEYQNTMRDLLGIDTDYVQNLPPDSVSADGFKNNGRMLQMSAMQLEYYLASGAAGTEQGDCFRARAHGVPQCDA